MRSALPTTPTTTKPKIVIVGVNFAGLSVALGLRGRKTAAEITLIDRRSHFEYTPSMHLALIKPEKLSRITFEFKKAFPDSFVQDEVTKINFEQRQVMTASKKSFDYDYLVVATGSETNFYDNESFIKCAVPFRHARDIENLHKNLETAHRITVIGGGYTGVEIATVLASETNKHVTLVHSRKKVLDDLNPNVSKIAQNYLLKKNVQLVLGDRVKTCYSDKIKLESGTILASDVHILTTGTKPNNQLLPVKNQVNEFLQLEDHPEVFVCGDAAMTLRYPTAHNAMVEGRIVARHLDDLIGGKQLTDTTSHGIVPEILAIALGRDDGILTYKKFGFYLPRLTGFLKWLVERRVLFELKHQVVLPL